MASNRTPFLTIRAEGALLPVDLLQRIVENDRDLGGLTPESYHLSGEKLNEAINRSWNRLLGAWAAFRVARERLPEGDAGTSVTREKWLLPLFDELDYGRLQTTRAIDIEGKSYAISHGWGDVPIHLVGCGAELDKRMAGVTGAAKASPHSLVQELLNRSPERLWGFVSNGLRLRVLRDNASLTRQAYLEFDLEAMMNGEVYADFVVLWLVCHESRVESREQRVGAECWLEVWSKAAQERGTRALDGLRVGVEKAIEALGKGFIGHPANGSLRSALSSGAVSTLELYRQLLRLVYRLIFLFVAEDRQLLYDPASDAEARKRYADYYSTARLRRMAERARGSRHADLYAALKLVMDKLGSGGAPELGLPALGGFLFSRAAMSALADCELSNAALLEAVRSLAFSQDGRVRRAVDYKNLGSEELGSIYESLLELHPLVNTDAATFELTAVSGSERKTTGSYYTPSSLIQALIDSALEPVISEALKRAAADDRPQTVDRSPSSVVQRQEQAILNLKVVDPACGSGHFLVAAAHRLARRLATVRTGEGEPAPEAMRSALRSVISNCIYGVDINPMSVELCKVSLWMEALEPGKPLSFLDAHIQCGDSLVGVSPNLDISEIPDEAFSPAFGDDKATSSALKKRNKRERGGSHADKAGQLGFRFEVTHMTSMDDLARWLAERAEQVDAMPEDDSTQVQAKAKAFDDYHATSEYLKNRFELDLWTAAFFWKFSKADGETMLAPTQQELIQLRNGGELDSRLVERVKELSERLNFFHWELAFPKVFSGDNPGFDCVLGNPPWERIKLQEEEFFATLDPEIAAAPNKAARQRLINSLTQSNPNLAKVFEDAKHAADATSKFVRSSGRFALSATGDINTYALFAENFRSLLSAVGRTGIIVPTGIATDDTTKDFFGDLIKNHAVVSLFDFENREAIFPGVHRSYKFCLLTVSSSPVTKGDYVFFATRVEHLRETQRHFSLTAQENLLVNPNTLTLPIFRTKSDAKLTLKIYSQTPVLINEGKRENFWGAYYMRLVDLGDHSSYLRFPWDEKEQWDIPLYESKLLWLYDHRFNTFENVSKEDYSGGKPRTVDPDEKANCEFLVTPRYYINNSLVKDLFLKYPDYQYNYFLVWRDVSNATNERTCIATIIPKVAASRTCPALGLSPNLNPALLLANLNSIVFDYIARQKVGGIHFNWTLLSQLPVLPPSAYTPADIDFIAPRVLELVYTANDLCPFAEDMGYHGEPFRWDEVRRAQLRAELTAYYARLYGLTRDELRYTLRVDPKEVHGEDPSPPLLGQAGSGRRFPGETFRVLKEKEVKQFGDAPQSDEASRTRGVG
ncbi:MAG: Eco57I restriction-modification methylase domain-containing protein [Chloroflexota bacterium]